MTLFRSSQGLIIACDIKDLKALERLVKTTEKLDFIEGYKIGAFNVVSYGITRILKVIRRFSKLPVIYDHQKYGTDIPDVCGGELLRIIKKSGVDGLIIFPEAGIETLKASVKGCFKNDLIPMVGGEMTHKGFIRREGGYIGDDSPMKIYRDAASLGVSHFIVPGNRLESLKKYRIELEEMVEDPVFLFPGVGAQGGDPSKVFQEILPHAGYAIVGRSIYGARDIKQAAQEIWNKVTSDLKHP